MSPIARLKQRLLTLAVAIGAAFGLIWLLWPEPAIGPTNYERIELGMTQADIEALIGLPPSHHYDSWLELATTYYNIRATKGKFEQGAHAKPTVEWRGDRYAIIVVFENGQTVFCYLHELGPYIKLPGILQRLRAWLGW